jgi:hypothetical protein
MHKSILIFCIMIHITDILETLFHIGYNTELYRLSVSFKAGYEAFISIEDKIKSGELKIELSESIFILALQRGAVAIVDYMLNSGVDFRFVPMFSIAAERGHIHLLEYLREKQITDGKSLSFSEYDDPCLLATTHGQIDSLDWLYKNGYNMDNMIDKAVEVNQPVSITYLHNKGQRASRIYISVASRRGYSEAVEILSLLGYQI